MNRVKHRSRRYEEARPEIEEMRARRKLARHLSRDISEDTPKDELRKMATLLAIPGRAKASKDKLLELIFRRRR